MTPDDVKNIVNGILKDAQYNVAKIPDHTHNGTDSSRIVAGDLVSGVSQIAAGTGISVSPVGGTGTVTVTNSGVTSLVAGTGVTLSGSTGVVTISTSPLASPIARDATSVGAGTGSTLTVSHTCTGSNGLLVSAIQLSSGGGSPTSLTYNGIPMTQQSAQTNFAGSSRDLYLYYLRSPSTGAHNLVLTLSGANADIECANASYTGINVNSSFPDSSNTGSASSGTSLNVLTTVVATNCWLIGAASSTSGLTAGAGTSLYVQQGAHAGVADSNGKVGTGSQGLTVIIDSGASAALSVMSVPPAVA